MAGVQLKTNYETCKEERTCDIWTIEISSIEDPEMVQMLESENKDLKNHCEKYVRGCRGKGGQCVMGNFSVEIKTMGMYKNGNVEMKNVMSGMKSLFEGLSRKQDRAEKRKQSKIGKLLKLVKGVGGKSGGKLVPISKRPLLVSHTGNNYSSNKL